MVCCCYQDRQFRTKAGLMLENATHSCDELVDVESTTANQIADHVQAGTDDKEPAPTEHVR